jgi:branched-subunit amino acid aminotransferase/4-amino-4-deoxychorismate lyase
MRIAVNGAPADVETLATVVATNYGAFTLAPVRAGAVQGLDLHLARLDRAARELFGRPLDLDAVRRWAAAAAEGGDCTLRINVFSRALDRRRPGAPVDPDVLIIAGAAPAPVRAPLRVRSTVYGREAPHLKHVGTFPLFDRIRQVQSEGFDDTLFVDGEGAVAEGSVWNVVFAKGDVLIFTDGPQLDGVGQRLLQRGLDRSGVRWERRRVTLADLGTFQGAAFINASAIQPIGGIDSCSWPNASALTSRLQQCYDTNPWERL